MSDRVSGYHYVTGRNGKKHRVYDNKSKAPVRRAPRAEPKGEVIRGKGSYYDSKFVRYGKKYVPKGTFRALGAGLGSIYGMPAAGSTLGGKLADLVGFGQYQVRKNSIVSQGTSPASMHNGNSSVLVRHREYITDIVSSSSANTFENQSFSLNPGLASTFPWLAPISAQYQEYVPRGIVFEFKTLTSQAIASSTNTTIGGVIMATEYNAVQPAFIDKQQMDNTEYTTSAPVYQSFYHPVECDMRQNPLKVMYNRSGAVPEGTDPRLYDLGNFQIATFGVQGTSVVLGELWVTYEFELLKPQPGSVLGTEVVSDSFSGFVASGFGESSPFQNSVASEGNTLGVKVNQYGSLTFPSGRGGDLFQVSLMWSGATAASGSPMTIADFVLSGVTSVLFYNGATTAIISSSIGTSVTASVVFQLSDGESPVVLFSPAAGRLPTGSTTWNLVITQVNAP